MKKSFTRPKPFTDCNYRPTNETQEVVAKETSTLLERMNSSISLWLIISTKSMKLTYNVTHHYKVYPYVVQFIIHTHLFGWKRVEGNQELKIILNYLDSIFHPENIKDILSAYSLQIQQENDFAWRNNKGTRVFFKYVIQSHVIGLEYTFKQLRLQYID